MLQIFQLSSGANNDGKEIQQVEQISVQIWRELRNRATGTYFSIGVAKLDRDVPLLLLLEADSVNSGESPHNGALAVSDVTNGPDVNSRLPGNHNWAQRIELRHVELFQIVDCEAMLVGFDGVGHRNTSSASCPRPARAEEKC